MIRAWLHIKEHLRARVLEWIISIALVLWGIIVLNTDGLFLKENYANMAVLASQTVWGVGAIVVGAVRLFFLTINGWWRPSAHIRAIGAFFSFMGWAAILTCYFALPFWIPNVATIGALAAIDLTSLWFAAEDAAQADNRASEKRTQ